MGIRICKDIGYLMTNEKLKDIISPDYENILEDLDDDDNNLQFLNSIITLMKSYKDSKNNSEVLIMHTLAKMYKQGFKKNNTQSYHLISQLYMNDDSQGLLFRSPELYKASRHDDLIDYYTESIETNDIRFLNRPIYPSTGYIYIGGLEQKFPELVIGHVYDNYLINNEYLVGIIDKKTTDTEQSYAQIVQSGFFIPNIDAFIFLIAKASGIVLPHVTELEFNKAVLPMIATYWS